MTARDPAASFQLLGLALLGIGSLGAVVAYKQSCSNQRQFANMQPPVADTSLAQDSIGFAPTHSAKAAVAANAVPTGVGGARTAATMRPEIDWESLVERTPEAALQRLRFGVLGDDSEAQRLSVYEVRALTKLQRIGEARARAEAYFERWPSGPDIVYLQGLTGAHPRQ